MFINSMPLLLLRLIGGQFSSTVSTYDSTESRTGLILASIKNGDDDTLYYCCTFLLLSTILLLSHTHIHFLPFLFTCSFLSISSVSVEHGLESKLIYPKLKSK
jgi:hypothetical protein